MQHAVKSKICTEKHFTEVILQCPIEENILSKVNTATETFAGDFLRKVIETNVCMKWTLSFEYKPMDLNDTCSMHDSMCIADISGRISAIPGPLAK